LPATGRPVDIRGCGVVHVDEAGLMASIDEYWNEMALLRQIGPVAIARKRSPDGPPARQGAHPGRHGYAPGPNGPVAQRSEQRTHNPSCGGSNPPRPIDIWIYSGSASAAHASEVSLLVPRC
jgi:hypothetical protein